MVLARPLFVEALFLHLVTFSSQQVYVTKTLVGLGLDMLTTLVNSQKGSDMRVRVSTYFDTADSKSGNRLALSDPVLIGAITYYAIMARLQFSKLGL